MLSNASSIRLEKRVGKRRQSRVTADSDPHLRNERVFSRQHTRSVNKPLISQYFNRVRALGL